MGGKKGLTLKERFMNSVNKTDSCWLWKGKIPAHGYGYIQINKKCYRAHRVSWEIYFGEIPKGMLVCHKCDVPSCVNPDHLFLGSDADNMRDRDEKCRVAHNKGEKCGKSKIKESDVIAIKTLFKSGATQTEIGNKLGINRKNVFNIVRGVSWRHVEV